jgi:hypothetical protein
MSNTYTYNPGYGAIPPPYGNISLSAVTGYQISNGVTGGNYVLNNNNTATNAVWIGQGHQRTSLKVEGDADINGNLVVQGTNITRLFQDIQERLGLLVPNPELEEEFEELQQIGDQYREVEARLKEKKRVWEILKKE